MRLSKLPPRERIVTLLLDEIYVQKLVEYSGSSGQIVGLTSEQTTASTVLCFMVCAVAGQYRDMVAMCPMDKLDAAKLHSAVMEVLRLLDDVGFDVIGRLCFCH